MLVQESNLNFPSTHSFENHASSRVEHIQQRIKERQQKLQFMEDRDLVICQTAHDIFHKPSTKTDLEQKLEMIRKRIQKRKKTQWDVEEKHKKVLQIANKALMQAKEEIQNVKKMQQEQKNVEQRMLMIHRAFTVVHQKAGVLKKEQIDISQNIKRIRSSVSAAFSNVKVLFPRLEKVCLEISEVQFYHQDINKEFHDLKDRSRLIQINQERLDFKLKAFRLSLSKNAIDWIINGNLIKHSRVKETLQKWIEHPVFHLAEKIVLPPSVQKLTEACEKIKEETQSIPSYFWTNLNSILSRKTGVILEVYRLKDRILPTLMQWVWTYVGSKVRPIMWIALGVFASYFAKSLISNYPLVSLAVSGYVCSVYMNNDRIKSMVSLKTT